MAPKIERVLSGDSIIFGEGPHWDAETQSLYFVDVFDHSINKYVPSTKKHTKANIGDKVSLIIPVKGKNDYFVIAKDRELLLLTWDGVSDTISIVKKLYEAEENTTFNDGKSDPSGRLWAGTMGVAQKEGELFLDEKGSLFSLQSNKITTQLTKIGLSNGLAFDTNAKKFYYNDSFKGTVDQFDFDVAKRTISNGRSIYSLRKERGVGNVEVLDGMTIDTDGNLWVAVFNLSKVVKIDPRRPETVLETIVFPAKQITSVAFGGPNLDELYVTSGRMSTLGGIELAPPENGALYKVTGLNTRGLPGDRIVL